MIKKNQNKVFSIVALFIRYYRIIHSLAGSSSDYLSCHRADRKYLNVINIMNHTQKFSIFTQFIHCCRIIFRIFLSCQTLRTHYYRIIQSLTGSSSDCLSWRQADRKYLCVINMIFTQKFSIFTQVILCCRIIFRSF